MLLNFIANLIISLVINNIILILNMIVISLLKYKLK